MSVENEWLVQVSPKLADGTLINVRGRNAAEFDSLLTYVTEKAPQIQALVASLTGANAVAAQLPVQSVQVQQDGAPTPSWAGQGAQQQAAAQGGAPMCAHGQRVWKSGTSKAGKAYKMWSCPSQNRQVQCEPEWVRD